MSLRVTIDDIALFERPMAFRLPFRFGAVTVTEAPQAFVRVRLSSGDGSSAVGVAAEMMMPKWFDKDPAKTPADTIADLRLSLTTAAGLYRRAANTPESAFGHHARVYQQQIRATGELGLPSLAGAYGPALIDKAIVDGVLKLGGLDLATGLRTNAIGLDSRLTNDVAQEDIDTFLQGITPQPRVSLRHTIGFVDAPDALADELGDARPRYFKIKLSGDVAADCARLRALAPVLEALVPDFLASLDANEQYDRSRLAELTTALRKEPFLSRLKSRLLYIEQPLDRAATFLTPIEDAGDIPFIIDEADGGYDAFPKAAALGYRGVSSKTCKGLYKSLINAARAAAWNRRDGAAGHWFVSGEDLTCQAGLGVQQDTALVACLGISHVERNGHHYVRGFGTAPTAEAARFAAAMPGLYERQGDAFVLAVGAGELPTAPLFTPGFASGATPDWASLTQVEGHTNVA
ncbi:MULTISPECIES: enolase [unclassified Chelatococcus]|uniref:enolase n=1 Tax=unclassified Chelatococcus TaxID=2638111 RepID=UPI001BCC49A3|nr:MULTISPECIES: enolase [unclassified Chelatococcus]MBS7697050.1 enolase [Chelatococcus sp. YT9]MBX3556040.1 enolase [Chelatococcus sp.]